MGRKLGQHFLKDRSIINKIIKIIDPKEVDVILEIGSGKGALTIPLSNFCKRIIAVEKDERLADNLRKKNLSNVEIINRDILSLNLKELVEGEITVVGNLPYYISSKILSWFIREKGNVKRGVFMLQKEVAERICSKPKSKSYSSLSIHTQIFYEPKIHFHVKPGSFSPPPEVVSSVIELKKREKPLVEIGDEEYFVKFLKNCFAKKRKTLINNLLWMGFKKEKIIELFNSLSIDIMKRPEEIEIEKFYNLLTYLRDLS